MIPSMLQSIGSLIKSKPLFWMIWGAVVLFNLFFYAGYVREKRQTAERLETEYGTVRRELAGVGKGDDAYRAFMAAKTELQRFRKMLPEERQLETVAEELRRIIGENGLVSDDDIRFKAEGIVDLLLLKYGMTLSLRGSYAQVKTALAEIQNSPRLLAIEKISLNAGERGGDQVMLTLTLSTYFRGSMQLQPLAG